MLSPSAGRESTQAILGWTASCRWKLFAGKADYPFFVDLDKFDCPTLVVLVLRLG